MNNQYKVKLITSGKYLSYPVNNRYNKNIKDNKNYDLGQDNMKEIYLALVHARDNIDRPIALRYTLGLEDNHSFDINKLTRKIKSIFKSSYSFIYSFEYSENQKGLHLEMMLIVDQTIHNPLSVYNLMKKIAFNLDGVIITDNVIMKNGIERSVVCLNFHERKGEYLLDIGGSKVGHNLKNEAQFKDCIYRASYLSKQNDKELVQYKRKFNAIKR